MLKSSHRNLEAAAPEQTRTKWSSVAVWAGAAAIVLAGVAVYSNSLSTPFVLDGLTFIRNNASLAALWPWNQTLGQNRPVGFFTFALNHRWHGTDVWGYHATNLAIHLAAGLILFGIIRRTLANPPLATRYGKSALALAAAISLLWVVHPLQTQSVTYIYQRLESLMGLFYLLTLYGFVRAQQSPHPLAWYTLSVLSCALGMGTKEVMLTAPLIVLWYDRALVSSSWRELFTRHGKYYLALGSTWIVLAALMASNWSAYQASGVLRVHNVTPWTYALTQAGVILHYLRLSVWPVGQCLDYAWPLASGGLRVFLEVAAVLTMVGLTVWCLRRFPALAFLGGWFFLILAPTSSIAPTADTAFEHRMYLPLAAVVAVAVLGVYELTQRRPAPSRTGLQFALFTVAALGLGIVTYKRNQLYANEVSLWQSVVETSPHNARGWVHYGVALCDAGRGQEAIACFDRALGLYGERADRKFLAGVYIDRGSAHAQLGHRDAAIADLNRAVDLEPGSALAYLNLAGLRAQEGRHARALADLDQALRLQPDFLDALMRKASYLTIVGRLDEALEVYDRVVHLQPRYAQAYVNRASLNHRLGRFQNAIDDYTQAIALSRPDAALYSGRGSVYVQMGNPQQAIQDLAHAIDLDSTLASAYITRGDARAALGDYASAISDYGTAIAREPNSAAAYNNRAMLLASAPDAQVRNGARAVEDANRACELSGWREVATIDTLAASYAEAGDFDQAVHWQREVIKRTDDEQLRRAAESRLELYIKKKPFHEEPTHK